MTNSDPASINWLLDSLVQRLTGVRHAVLLSADGMLLGHDARLARDDAERFCAISSALYGLSRSVGHHFDAGGVCQTVVDLDRAVLFLTAAGDNACLALLASETTDMGTAAYELNLTVQQVGRHLGTDRRHYVGRS